MSTSHVGERVHGHARPLAQARGMCAPRTALAARATGGPNTRLPAVSVPRRRLAVASAGGAAGWAAGRRVPSVCAASGGSERVPVLPWETA